MTTIVTRAGKGSPLTHTEVDTNFTNLNTAKLEAGAIALGSAAAPSISFVSDTNTGIFSPGADQLAISTNGTSRLNIDASGNVGVGTDSPTTFNGFRTLELANSSGSAISLVTGSSVIAQTISSSINSLVYMGTRSNHGLVLTTNDSERARIDSSGRLLVGTSSQLGNGIAQFKANTDSSTGEGIIMLAKGDAATAGQSLGQIKFINSTGNQAAWITGEADTGWGGAGSADYPGRLVFSTTSDSADSPTERMRITSAGDLYFNTTVSTKTTAGFRIENSGIPSVSRGTDGTFMQFFGANDGAQIGGITNSGGTATAYNTSSDYRLKENVAPVNDGITRLQQLKPSRFNFIAEPNRTVDGFLAHEVQEVIPEAITGEKDAVDDEGNPVHQGIDQSKLVPLLTAALQEAIAKIESLEARLTAAGL